MALKLTAGTRPSKYMKKQRYSPYRETLREALRLFDEQGMTELRVQSDEGTKHLAIYTSLAAHIREPEFNGRLSAHIDNGEVWLEKLEQNIIKVPTRKRKGKAA